MNTTTKNNVNNIIPFKEFRINSEKYINALEKGMSFIVVKRSKPIFRLEPMGESWETLVDFTNNGKQKGIQAEKLLHHMKKYAK